MLGGPSGLLHGACTAPNMPPSGKPRSRHACLAPLLVGCVVQRPCWAPRGSLSLHGLSLARLASQRSSTAPDGQRAWRGVLGSRPPSLRPNVGACVENGPKREYPQLDGGERPHFRAPSGATPHAPPPPPRGDVEDPWGHLLRPSEGDLVVRCSRTGRVKCGWTGIPRATVLFFFLESHATQQHTPPTRLQQRSSLL